MLMNGYGLEEDLAQYVDGHRIFGGELEERGVYMARGYFFC